jgi:hypothetical protein
MGRSIRFKSYERRQGAGLYRFGLSFQ